jgi:pilus assembly protein Flp/PilA
MTKFVTRFLKDESGATAIEYGLIAALISVVIVGAVGAIGTKLAAAFEKINGELGA